MLLGLEGSGKTALLYRLKTGMYIETEPTGAGLPSSAIEAREACNVEDVDFGGRRYVVWDLGGAKRLRSAWRHFWTRDPVPVNGLVFVVDGVDTAGSADGGGSDSRASRRGRGGRGPGMQLAEARKALHTVLEDPELAGVPLLVVVSKTDLADVRPDTHEVAQRYGAALGVVPSAGGPANPSPHVSGRRGVGDAASLVSADQLASSSDRACHVACASSMTGTGVGAAWQWLHDNLDDSALPHVGEDTDSLTAAAATTVPRRNGTDRGGGRDSNRSDKTIKRPIRWDLLNSASSKNDRRVSPTKATPISPGTLLG